MTAKAFIFIFSMIFLAFIELTEQISTDEKHIIKEMDNMLQKSDNNKNSLFDAVGSIDIAIWKRTYGKDAIEPLYMTSFGKSQVKNVSIELSKLQTTSPSTALKEIANKFLPKIPDVFANNGASSRNQYRIASITKTFLGVAATIMSQKYGLDLNTKISPKYINLTTLGHAHGWNKPTVKNGYELNFSNAEEYIKTITFRHLLTHTSGLSRESKNGSLYSYGSSRTSTPKCPPYDKYQGLLDCNQLQDNNWRAWTRHVVSYMMPACGYNNYNEKSNLKSCLPGEYYHYSNAGFSILGLSLDNYLKTINTSFTLEDWVTENVLHKFGMNDTVFTWIDFNREQKQRTAHGCYGGKDWQTCDQKRALTDYTDRGIKTPPGGIWSTTTDLAKYVLNLHTIENISSIFEIDKKFASKVDSKSEEDPVNMPLTQFKYGHGWYIGDEYSCIPQKHTEHFQGAWGTVPGFTSYVISNTKQKARQSQYVIIMLRSYNYAGRINLGNQARRYLWRLLHPDISTDDLACPVLVKDMFPKGDELISDKPSRSILSAYPNVTVIVFLAILRHLLA